MEREDPNRAKDLQDWELPNDMKSKTLRELPR
jgi:hypothetical protein